MAETKEKEKEPVKKKGKFSFKRIFTRIGRFFKDIVGEGKKIVWPTRQQTVKNTITVLVMVVLIGVVIWGLDAILSLGVTAILRQA